MAQIRIPCLVPKTNKAGITSWYWQPSKTLKEAGWRPLSLGKDQALAIQAANLRNAEVKRWKAGEGTLEHIQKRAQAGTLSALIARYRRDRLDKVEGGKRVIAQSTAGTYNTSLRRLEAWAGKHPLAFITRQRVLRLRDIMMGPEDQGGIGHHAAHQTLKMGRTLFKFALDNEMVERNPFEKFGLDAPAPRDVVWSAPAREAMILAAYECGRPSMALAIMLGFATGQREQDYLALSQRQYVAIPEHKMQPEDFATLAAMAPNGIPMGIRVRQKKTNAWVEVPVVGNVRWAIEDNIRVAQAGGAATILLDDTRGNDGKAAVFHGPNGQKRFQHDFADIRDEAIQAAIFDGETELATELARLHFSDLRRTCVVYLGELGMDAHLIAGVTGHDIDETQRILRVYMPRTTGRAARAIALASVREAKRNEKKAKSA
ncbi:hypothetical protein HT136_01240 [Novosphingobium profundi]|uniref:hypothetical protein n=1 Tax=Novosphingobium profundi TaxID=1774954 RepID=UPI001BD9C724|nr:hypothetical protein [Novosphingobium profundi]MBT0666990.1 hypothetical protein [Novosphingobium profundi]